MAAFMVSQVLPKLVEDTEEWIDLVQRESATFHPIKLVLTLPR